MMMIILTNHNLEYIIVRQVLAPREQRYMCICNLQIVDIYQNIRPRQHTGDIGNDAL